MKPEQHADAKDIFLRACAVPPDRRAAFLEQACGADAALRRHVDRLLEFHQAGAPAAEPTQNTRDEARAIAAEVADLFALPEFETGQEIAGRYRIVAPLGEGGMGRVYRAEDLRLRTTVALKFLAPLHEIDPIWRRRVQEEVKLAREVAHPNVCRVFDVGETRGIPFISMEFIQGEDLGTLLQRVGRLTGDRAIEIARQICIGLAAAHIHGVLHRDLKPANVMIDDKGVVHLSDFGLAAISGNVQTREIRAGTPRYMAPEQLAGDAVTEKSDIYALGLVLYELFTGQPAFDAANAAEYLKLRQSTEPVAPSRLVPELSPAIDDIILACLRRIPAERPESALVVAAALPGGDLLAAALAAGEVPSREMVASAAAQVGISAAFLQRYALAFAVLLALSILLGRRAQPIARDAAAIDPEALISRSREINRMAGVHGGVIDSDRRYTLLDAAQRAQLESTEEAGGRQFGLAPDIGLVFCYRESRGPPLLSARLDLPFITDVEPRLPLYETPERTTKTILRPDGRLLEFEWRPSEGASTSPAAPADWRGLVRMAGFLPASFRSMDGQSADSIALADGEVCLESVPASPNETATRIYILSDQGRIQRFAVLSLLPSEAVPNPWSATPRRALLATLHNAFFLLLLAAAVPAALRNGRARGDITGAVRLGAFILLLRLAVNLLQARHVQSFPVGVENLARAAVGALCDGMIAAIFYLALELHVRRLWPRTLGGWSRILAGRFRDPVVGRDVLVGTVVGLLWANLVFLDRIIPDVLGWPMSENFRAEDRWAMLLGSRDAVAGLLLFLRLGIYAGLTVLFLLVVSTWLSGARRSLGIAAAWLVVSALYATGSAHMMTGWTLIAFGCVGVAILVLIRYGLVAIAVALLAGNLLGSFPITLDLSRWYAGYGFFAVLTLLGFAAWGLAQAARPLAALSRKA